MNRRLVCLLAVLQLLACQGCERPDPDTTGPREEERVKSRVPPDGAVDGSRDLDLAQYRLSFQGLRVIPSGLAFLEGRLYLIDNQRSALFSVPPDHLEDMELTPVSIGRRLEFPTALAASGKTLFVLDHVGLAAVDIRSMTSRTVRAFGAVNDLAPIPDGRLVFNLFSPGRPRSSLVITSATLRPNVSWPAEPMVPSGHLEALRALGHLAVCGNKVVLAYRHRPELRFFDLTSGDSFVTSVPFPNSADLLELAERPELATPDPSMAWQPSYLAGVACTSTAILVLLDTPELRLLEFGFDGAPKGSHVPAQPMSVGKRFNLLTATTDAVFTVAGDQLNANRRLVRIRLTSADIRKHTRRD